MIFIEGAHYYYVTLDLVVIVIILAFCLAKTHYKADLLEKNYAEPS